MLNILLLILLPLSSYAQNANNNPSPSINFKAQTTTLYFQDTLQIDKKIRTTIPFPSDTAYIDVLHRDLSIYRLWLKDLVWLDTNWTQQYHPIQFGVLNHHFPTAKDSLTLVYSFDNGETYHLKMLSDSHQDTLRLNFYSKKVEQPDTVDVLVKIRKGGYENVAFYPIEVPTTTIELADEKYLLEFWPYQTGPRFSFYPPLFQDTTEIFRIGERFIKEDTIYSIVNFNYASRSAILQKAVKPPMSTYYGYKTGRIFKDFVEGEDYLKELGIETNRLTIFYFGGDWCRPCHEELPRWKRIGKVALEKGIQVVSINYDINERGEIAYDYLNYNDFPGTHVVIDDASPLLRNLRIEAFPTYVFVNGEGQILARIDTFQQRQKQLELFFSKLIKDL